MSTPSAPQRHDLRALRLKAALLAVWAAASFGFFFFARDLQFVVAGWPFAYWMGAQGAILVFIAIVAIYAIAMQRLAPEDNEPSQEPGPHA